MSHIYSTTSSLEPSPQSEQPKVSTYRDILTSTALVGGSQVINIIIGIARTKAMALFLGPTGFGLAGLYMSVATLAQSIAGMGINSSGVRQIAQATGTGDEARVAGTVYVLRRVSLVLGLLGALALVVLAKPISTITFGDDGRVSGIRGLAAVVFLNLVSAGQCALIQGLRRISDLAKISILGALFGTVATIPLVYFFRQDGVVPSLISVSIVTVATSWWYSRKIKIRRTPLTKMELQHDAAGMLKLGLAFMSTGMMAMGSAYVIRIIVSNKLGLAATGLYQAAWTLGGLYVGVILQAMGSDFYPRLSAVAHNRDECNRLVNEQVQVSMLLAGPGVLATLTLASLVVSLFYTPTFAMAVGALRWICLGIAMRVISWPLGYILVAKGAQASFVCSDLIWTIAHLVLALLLVEAYGLDGAGMAFFGSYVVHIALNYGLVRRLGGFRWSTKSIQTGLVYVATLAVAFYAVYIANNVYVGMLSALASCVFAVRGLFALHAESPLNRMRFFDKLLSRFC